MDTRTDYLKQAETEGRLYTIYATTHPHRGGTTYKVAKVTQDGLQDTPNHYNPYDAAVDAVTARGGVLA